MTYFVFVRASKRSGGARHWFRDMHLNMSEDVLAAGAFSEKETTQIAKMIPAANVYRVPCDSDTILTKTMRRTLRLA